MKPTTPTLRPPHLFLGRDAVHSDPELLALLEGVENEIARRVERERAAAEAARLRALPLSPEPMNLD